MMWETLNRGAKVLLQPKLVARAMALLLVVSLLAPRPAQANAKLLFSTLGFVSQNLVSYAFGKLADRALGQDLETQLRKREGVLEREVSARGRGDLHALEEELDVVRNQLEVLQKLLYGDLNAQDIAALQRQVHGDLPRIERLLTRQGQRISGLEGEMGDVRARLQALESRLSMPSFEKEIALHIGDFSTLSSNLPLWAVAGAQDVLAAEISKDPRVSLTARLAPVDTLIEGRVRRYSVDERMYSGYQTRPRLTIFHTLELSLFLKDSRGERIYLSESYTRTAREFLPAGAYSSSSDFGVFHQLLASALEAGAADFLSFVFLEPRPPEPDEEVELDR